MIEMTTMQAVTSRVARLRSGRAAWDRRRRRLALGAVAMTIPYSALKVAWLCGSRIGLRDGSFGTGPTMHVLNALTLGLDLVALSLAFIFRSGARAPRWFVLPTMWVGYGLLGQILLVNAPMVFVQVLADPPSHASAAPIAGWVYAAVYAGFSGLGLCLLPAFAIYAWQRWGTTGGWAQRLGGRQTPLPALPMWTTAIVVYALMIRAITDESATMTTAYVANAILGIVAVASIRAAATGLPTRLQHAVPLLAVWTVSGAWTAWGCYQLVLTLVPNDLVTETVPVVDTVLAVAKAVAGVSLLFAIPRLSRR